MQLKNVAQNDGEGGNLLAGMVALDAVEGCDADRIARMNTTRAVEGTTALTDDGSGPVSRTLQRTGLRTLPSGLGRRLAHARADGGSYARRIWP